MSEEVERPGYEKVEEVEGEVWYNERRETVIEKTPKGAVAYYSSSKPDVTFRETTADGGVAKSESEIIEQYGSPKGVMAMHSMSEDLIESIAGNYDVGVLYSSTKDDEVVARLYGDEDEIHEFVSEVEESKPRPVNHPNHPVDSIDEDWKESVQALEAGKPISSSILAAD